MSGVNLQAIYNRLNSVPRYHPMSANTFADWAMEAGDIVTVSRGGTSYQSPVGTSTLKWSGKQQIQIATEGSRERDAISRISARKYAKGGGGGSGMRGTQELYWEMFSEDGQLHAVISATAESLTADYTQKIGDVDDALEGKITVTAEQLRTEYTDRINNTQTQINQNASTLSMAVGRVKYSGTAHYANKTSFPATGTAGVLYYADDTGYAYLYMPGTHSYERATADEFGNANFLKAGEIAISINESGQTAAKLDADVIYAGRGSTTIADLELPDWMDTTEGLIATKATIVDLNALRARVGTLEADSITTDYLASHVITTRGLVVTNSIQAGGAIYANSGIYFGTPDGSSSLKQGFIGGKITSSGNTYTLVMSDFTGTEHTIGTFSRAVSSVSWSWSGGMAKAVLTPQNQTFYSKQLDAIQPHGQPTWDNDNKGFTVTLDVDDTSGTTAFSDSIHFSTLTSYNAGVTEGEGAFTPATVTLQGSGRYVTAINANAGIKVTNTLKYNAGSGYTLYEGGDWYDYYDVGSSDTLYKSGGDLKLVGYLSKGATVSDAGTYYRAVSYGTGDNHLRGSSVTPTRRTGYRRGSQVTGTNQGSAVAVYVSDTNGTQYYQAGDTSYVYSAGSTVSDTYYTKIS